MEQGEIRKIVCQKCGGSPMEVILPGWPYPSVGVVCHMCGYAGPRVYFTTEGDTLFHGIVDALLPGLARARREAAALWNEQPRERTHPGRGTEV